jgi:hypothetical protein
MYNFRVTYFPPSAPQQAEPNPVVTMEAQATEFVYNDGVLMFGTAINGRAVYTLAIPTELMPIVENLGPVV